MLTRDGEREVQRGGGGGGLRNKLNEVQGGYDIFACQGRGRGLGNLWKTIKVILSTLQAGTKK